VDGLWRGERHLAEQEGALLGGFLLLLAASTPSAATAAAAAFLPRRRTGIAHFVVVALFLGPIMFLSERRVCPAVAGATRPPGAPALPVSRLEVVRLVQTAQGRKGENFRARIFLFFHQHSDE
jgi:hypothetical protein